MSARAPRNAWPIKCKCSPKMCWFKSLAFPTVCTSINRSCSSRFAANSCKFHSFQFWTQHETLLLEWLPHTIGFGRRSDENEERMPRMHLHSVAHVNSWAYTKPTNRCGEWNTHRNVSNYDVEKYGECIHYAVNFGWLGINTIARFTFILCLSLIVHRKQSERLCPLDCYR